MKEKKDIEQVTHLISWWLSKIKTNNHLELFDINRFSEDIAAMLLNEIFNYNLVNLNNNTKRNHSAIDLGDIQNKIAFQVTSRTDLQKIKKNLETFARKHKKNYPNGIRFLILSMEESKIKNLKENKSLNHIYPDFIPMEHILSEKEIIRSIASLYTVDKKRFIRIRKILEEEIAEKL